MKNLRDKGGGWGTAVNKTVRHEKCSKRLAKELYK